MKKILLAIAAIVPFMAVAQDADPFSNIDELIKNTRAAETNIPGAEFPRTDSHNRVYFHYKSPNTQALTVDICSKKFFVTLHVE